jgi:hypothetical protein
MSSHITQYRALQNSLHGESSVVGNNQIIQNPQISEVTHELAHVDIHQQEQDFCIRDIPMDSTPKEAKHAERSRSLQDDAMVCEVFTVEQTIKPNVFKTAPLTESDKENAQPDGSYTTEFADTGNDLDYDFDFEDDVFDRETRCKKAALKAQYSRVSTLFGSPEKYLPHHDGTPDRKRPLTGDQNDKPNPVHENSDWEFMSYEDRHTALLCSTLLDSKLWATGAIASTDRIYKHAENRKMIER